MWSIVATLLGLAALSFGANSVNTEKLNKATVGRDQPLLQTKDHFYYAPSTAKSYDFQYHDYQPHSYGYKPHYATPIYPTYPTHHYNIYKRPYYPPYNPYPHYGYGYKPVVPKYYGYKPYSYGYQPYGYKPISYGYGHYYGYPKPKVHYGYEKKHTYGYEPYKPKIDYGYGKKPHDQYKPKKHGYGEHKPKMTYGYNEYKPKMTYGYNEYKPKMTYGYQPKKQGHDHYQPKKQYGYEHKDSYKPKKHSYDQGYKYGHYGSGYQVPRDFVERNDNGAQFQDYYAYIDYKRKGFEQGKIRGKIVTDVGGYNKQFKYVHETADRTISPYDAPTSADHDTSNTYSPFDPAFDYFARNGAQLKGYGFKHPDTAPAVATELG